MRNTYSAITVVTGLTTVYCRTPSLHLKSNTLVEKDSGSHPHPSIHPCILDIVTPECSSSYSPMGHGGQQHSGGRCGCCCCTSSMSTRLGYWLLRKFSKNTRKL